MAVANQKKESYQDALILFQRCYDLRSDRTHKTFDEALMIQSTIDLIQLSEDIRMEDDRLKVLFTTTVDYYRNNPQTDREIFYSILFQFGLFLHRLEEYDECCRCQEEGLQLAIELYTKENIQSLASMRNLALTYYRLQRTIEYQKLIPECYEISCRVLGETEPFTMSVARDRVLQMATIGQYSDALPLAEIILEQLTKRHGEDHGETVQALITLGYVQSNSGNRKKAIESYSKALALRILTLGPDNFYTIDLTHLIAELLIREGRLEEAHEILISFLPRVRTIPQMKTHYARITYYLGEIATKQKKFSDAVEMLQESWGVVSKLYDSKHPDCISTMVACGKAFCKVGEMKRGSRLLHDAWALRSQTLGSNHPQTLEVLKLIQFLNLPLEI
jgi:tetratricopeptide (TPR) repeat protein